jgi:hypothetical protein
MKRLLAIAVGLAVGGTVAITFFSQDSHPEFGPIRSTQWIEPHPPSGFVGLVLEVKNFLGVAPPPTRELEYLQIGSSRLEWSLMNTKQKSGWLYFHRPESNVLSHEYIWEFAPCARVNLADLTRADLGRAQFVRAHETNQIQAAFNADFWVETVGPGYVIPVREGQIVLARLISAPDTVYALKFKNQVGADSWGGIRIDYLQADAKP